MDKYPCTRMLREKESHNINIVSEVKCSLLVIGGIMGLLVVVECLHGWM